MLNCLAPFILSPVEDNCAVFGITGPGAYLIAWFDSPDPLRSGLGVWTICPANGVTCLQTDVGNGTVFLFGPLINFRAEDHGTFKFFSTVSFKEAKPRYQLCKKGNPLFP